LLTAIAWAGQIAENGGPGSWVTGLTSGACFLIAFLSIKNGEKKIPVSDWVCFVLALSAIPLWIMTKDPLWSIILVTGIDTVSFIPTFRKSWEKPNEELLLTYWLSSVKFTMAIIALDVFNVVTVLYPLSLVIMNGSFVAMSHFRKKYLAQKK
jgi:hypothetical protein